MFLPILLVKLRRVDKSKPPIAAAGPAIEVVALHGKTPTAQLTGPPYWHSQWHSTTPSSLTVLWLLKSRGLPSRWARHHFHALSSNGPRIAVYRGEEKQAPPKRSSSPRRADSNRVEVPKQAVTGPPTAILIGFGENGPGRFRLEVEWHLASLHLPPTDKSGTSRRYTSRPTDEFGHFASLHLPADG